MPLDGLIPVIVGSGTVVTVKPSKGAETPPCDVTVNVRAPVAASAAMATVTGRLVAVPPLPMVAVTPEPLNATAVAPFRFAPEIVAPITAPWLPLDGLIPVITGGARIGKDAVCANSAASLVLPALRAQTPTL